MSQEDAAQLDLIGGELCLDFANTVGNHRGQSPNEHLDNYADLVVWGRHVGILSPHKAQALIRESRFRPEAAQIAYERAIALRESFYRIFTAASTHATPRSADLDRLNSVLSAALPHQRIIAHAGGFDWGWEEGGEALDQMLWPVARSAADLLTSERVERVRECEGDTCGWLFIDASKNHSRRWCSMGDCGNRAKARRFYERQKTSVS